MFDEYTNDAEWAFQYAVEVVNNERYNMTDNSFESISMRVDYGNQFDASKKLCRLLKVRSIFLRWLSEKKSGKF